MLWKKNAILMGTIRSSHCVSVRRKLESRRISRGTRLYFASLRSAEQQGAGGAGADQLAADGIDKVRMSVGDLRGCTTRSVRRSAGDGRTAAIRLSALNAGDRFVRHVSSQASARPHWFGPSGRLREGNAPAAMRRRHQVFQ